MAQSGFTAEFGMGSGGSRTLWPPSYVANVCGLGCDEIDAVRRVAMLGQATRISEAGSALFSVGLVIDGGGSSSANRAIRTG